MSYVLLNPFIEGKEFKSTKKNERIAAEDIWGKFSSNIKNYVPEFFFTIKNTTDGSLHHFKVEEEVEQNKVNYTLSKFKKSIDDNAFKAEIDNLLGGKHHKHKKSDSESSSSSSSSDHDYKFRNRGLTLSYYPSIYGVRNVLLPSFVSTFTPFVRLNFPTNMPVVFRYS